MRMVLFACCITAALAAVPTAAHGEESESSDSVQQNSATPVEHRNRVVTPEGDVYHDVPPPYDRGTVAVQTLAGTAVTMLPLPAAIVAWALIGTVPSWFVAATALAIPVAIPATVNLVGTARGYPPQHLGAYLGSLAGNAAALALGGAYVWLTENLYFEEVEEALLMLGLLISASALPIAGPIIGYHRQAAGRQEVRDERGSMSLSVAPFVEPGGEGAGAALIWSSKF